MQDAKYCWTFSVDDAVGPPVIFVPSAMVRDPVRNLGNHEKQFAYEILET